MEERALNELAGWVTQAGLIGRTESELMAGFCQRTVAAGIRLARSIVILDTLHPIYEGRAFRLHDLTLFQIGKETRDGLARGANHLRDLLMSEGKFHTRFLFRRLAIFRTPLQEKFGEFFRG